MNAKNWQFINAFFVVCAIVPWIILLLNANSREVPFILGSAVIAALIVAVLRWRKFVWGANLSLLALWGVILYSLFAPCLPEEGLCDLGKVAVLIYGVIFVIPIALVTGIIIDAVIYFVKRTRLGIPGTR